MTSLTSVVPFTTKDGSTIHELHHTALQSLAQATLDPGQATQRHYHRRSEELYFLQSGSGRLRVGDEYRDVRAGECVVIPPGAIHKLTNCGEVPIRLLCCCAPPYTDADTVLTGG